MSLVSLIAMLGAFVLYLAMMIVVGAIYMAKTSNAEDYFLGGRGLNAWVAALSAGASDMSGWLLMGLPGSVYALGTGQAWIAIGLFLGTVANWLFISKRLRRYTIVANNSLTLPEFFENRFHDRRKILLTISSVVIVIFFLVYTASALASGGKLFNTVFGVDYHIALAIGAVVILAYTFMGGFKAVCVTDFIQGTLMLIGLMIVPIIAYAFIGGDLGSVIDKTDLGYPVADYFSLFSNGGKPYTVVEILSQLAWGLGYCGMPHILVRFMAVKDEKEIKKSAIIGSVWTGLGMLMACIIGIVGRAFLYPTVLGVDGAVSSESVFIEMIKTLFTKNIAIPFIGGIFLCGILAAVMSTADSQLLVCASSVSKDIYKNLFKPSATDKHVLNVSRVTVIVVAVVAFVIAWNPDSSIMQLVSDAWAGLGSAFGPLVVCALFWKRTNLPGAIAGILSGGIFVIVWDYIPMIKSVAEDGKTVLNTLGTTTGIYSLLIGFFVSLLMIILVSLVTKAPSKEILDEFEQVKNPQ